MQSVKDNLLAAFRYLLKPLVRMAVKNGVSFPDFSEALKKAFVDVAARQLAGSKRDVTEEGISVITSIETKDVRAVLQAGANAAYGREAQEAAPLAVVLSAWHTDPDYTGPYGVLRDLEFVALTPPTNRSSLTLTDLVRTYCPGVSAQSILDELMRLGAVQEVGNGFYRAVRRSYVADSLSRENIIYMARVVHNICETLEKNVRPTSAGGRGLIERTISTQHGISRKDHVEFERFIKEKGQSFSDDVDNWLTARDAEGISDGMRVGVGLYQYIVNEDDESALTKDFPQ